MSQCHPGMGGFQLASKVASHHSTVTPTGQSGFLLKLCMKRLPLTRICHDETTCFRRAHACVLSVEPIVTLAAMSTDKYTWAFQTGESGKFSQ